MLGPGKWPAYTAAATLQPKRAVELLIIRVSLLQWEVNGSSIRICLREGKGTKYEEEYTYLMDIYVLKALKVCGKFIEIQQCAEYAGPCRAVSCSCSFPICGSS
ncbi:hypothetical protein CHS0354_020909 [Potamilus streckersoni]|uniref:Uncharacterized protein n=1 Tax=Potamilus streckersoni TaxID=2493646 RepID=A0AAE0W1P0_9BIVA|nr:hypothetical protein CHS0354_020909 [Potamilus streckersoni]